MAKIDQEIKTRFENNKHRFVTNLIFTANWFQSNFASFIKPFGISTQQFNVLRILRGAQNWVNMNDIKQLMIDKTPNTTRLSDKLLDKGYVERRRCDHDRRVVFLKITDRGLDLLSDIDKTDALYFHESMDRISEEEAILFSDLLDNLRG